MRWMSGILNWRSHLFNAKEKDNSGTPFRLVPFLFIIVIVIVIQLFQLN